MTADERLALIQVKIERAKKHIVDLQGELAAFFLRDPYKVVPKKDPESGKLRYYMAHMEPFPTSLAVITGDAIQNLRSALDHLAHNLLLVHLGVATTDEWTNFPITNSAKDYESTLKGKAKRFRQDALDALLSVQAYKGGKGHQIWLLNLLNNIDKHRLILTVASAGGSIILSSRESSRGIEQRFGLAPGSAPVAELVLYPANPTILKLGDEVFIANRESHGDFNPEKDGKFHFYVSLNEPQVLKGGPLLETLQHFADLVSDTVLLFKPCLS